MCADHPIRPLSPSRLYSNVITSKPLPQDPVGRSSSHDSSSSIAPSHSASNVALPLTGTGAGRPNGISTDDTSYSAEQRGARATIPAPMPAPKKDEGALSTPTPTPMPTRRHSTTNAPNTYNKTSPTTQDTNPNNVGAYIPPLRPFSRHITDDNDSDREQPFYDGRGSSDEEGDIGPVTIVQNPRFAAAGASSSGGAGEKGGRGSFSIRRARGRDREGFVFPGAAVGATASEVALRSSPEKRGHGFFGSIRGLFKGKEKGDVDSDDDDGYVYGYGAGAGRLGAGGERMGSFGAGAGMARPGEEREREMREGKGKAGPQTSVSGGSQKLRKSKGPKKTRTRTQSENQNQNQNQADKKGGEGSVSRWIADTSQGHGQGTINKSKGGTVKKPKPNPLENGAFYLAPSTTANLSPSRRNSGTLSDSHLPISTGSGAAIWGGSANASGGRLSRDNSVGRGSIVSAPGHTRGTGAGAGRTRRASTMSNTLSNSGTGNEFAFGLGGEAGSGSRSPTPSPTNARWAHHAEPVRISAVDKSSPTTVSKSKSHAKRSGSGSGGELVVNGISGGNGSQSLMSIVEGVSRANREGWQAHKASKSVPVTTNYSAQPSSWGAGTVPRAAGRTSKLGAGPDSAATGAVRAVPSSANSSATIMVLPKAPGSVIPPTTTNRSGHVPAGGINGGGNGREAVPVIVAPSPVVPSASVSTSSGVFGSNSSLAANRPPLKSALRVSSRTPSPMPQAQHSRRGGSLDVLVGSQERRRSIVELNELVWKDKGKEREKEEDESSSVSSYETGHENPGEEETEREDDTPPKPPPHDQPSSDVSGSTSSTQTASVPIPARKSVRVSLQPTFSATPPAFEDDDESHAPWGGQEGTREEGERGKKKKKQKPKPEGEGERDVWEDSSEEDDEYRKARRMLLRVGEKKTKK